MNLPKWAEDFLNSVTVIHGAHERRLLLAGQSVAAVRAAFTARFDIPPHVIAVVNGDAVEPSYVLKAQDTLEFIRATGERERASDEHLRLKLMTFCAALPPGPVADVRTLEPLVAAIWHTLPSDDPSMEGYKLRGRMEAVVWNAPTLSFMIERHGGTALGSTRAEMQQWEVDLEKKAATLAKTGHRQLRPMAKRIYIKPLVARILDAVRSGKEDNVVSWHDDGKVSMSTTTIFPTGSAVRMTLEGRWKRLRDAVAGVLMKEGWERLGPDCFKRKGSDR